VSIIHLNEQMSNVKYINDGGKQSMF